MIENTIINHLHRRLFMQLKHRTENGNRLFMHLQFQGFKGIDPIEIMFESYRCWSFHLINGVPPVACILFHASYSCIPPEQRQEQGAHDSAHLSLTIFISHTHIFIIKQNSVRICCTFSREYECKKNLKYGWEAAKPHWRSERLIASVCTMYL